MMMLFSCVQIKKNDVPDNAICIKLDLASPVLNGSFTEDILHRVKHILCKSD